MSDYLTDEEQLVRLRDWWQKNGTTLLVGVFVVVAGVVGWRWYQGDVDERIALASDLYVQFQAAEGEARDALAEDIQARAKGTAYPAFVLLQQASDAVAREDPAAAEGLLRQAEEAAPDTELADAARLRLARVLFDLDRTDDALAVLTGQWSAGYRSLAAELKGDIHLFRDERALAHESYTAAMSFVEAGDQRPVLEMKIADTADARNA